MHKKKKALRQKELLRLVGKNIKQEVLKACSDQEVFTELMLRVPRAKRYCLFAGSKELVTENNWTYKIHDSAGFEIDSKIIDLKEGKQ